MVLRGQYLERPALVDAGDAVLEGLYHRGVRRPALLVCSEPGARGGMDAPIAAELAWAAARAGHASLRFQHRGYGASQGRPDPDRLVPDALAALAHLVETAGGAVVVAGVGAGCLVALAVARGAPVAGVALVDPGGLPPRAGLEAPILLVVPDGASGARASREAWLDGRSGRVELVPDADPGFHRGLPRAGRAVADWIATRA